ncbi:ABC transporter family substrate-binding protein [Streptoalloteichus hindustanus]|uniref:Peptide/nickel transport system substrate-binding protein n=1 Tax=Streptoalloteichus hindustanus TaxID=2017 RepID=A0A1M5IZQ9_STRHI|nr:ABC transporter family substrate-binding protein [Streptoalloteichus hindustanus]SHG33605.1 peptide/nickel transport system substrate-binding protein [Streptoalloteichus hindustanus]
MRRTKFVSAVALVSGAALALSACGGGGGSGTGGDADVAAMAVAKGENEKELTYTSPDGLSSAGTISVSTDKPFTSYNNETADANNSYNTFILTPVLAATYKVDGNQKVILNKDVVESVEVATNPQKVTYKLKKGLTWSDGAPWGCKDFYLTWLSRSGKSKKADGSSYFLPASTSGYEKIAELACPDPQTVVTTYAENYPDYKGLFGGGDTGPLPAHIVEKQAGIPDLLKVTPTDAASLEKIATFWNTGWKGFTKDLMPASGPYMITDWKQNQSITLERNPKWPGPKGGPDKIVVKSVPDSVAQAQALENGENQILASMQPDANAADRLRNLNSQGVKYGSEQGLTFEHLDLNFRNPLLSDKEVRKAFFMAVNRKDITDKLVGPVVKDAKPMGSLIFYPGEDGYQDHYSDKSKGSADEAKKILEAAGWKLGGDGVYAKDGQRLSLKVSHTDIPRRKKTVEILMGQAKAAGIEVKDDTDPNFLDGRVDKGDYDIALFAWSGAPFKADKKPIYHSAGTQNWQKVVSPAADAALDKAVTQTDPAAAIPLYKEADKALSEEYASLPLFQTPNMWAFKGVDRVWHQSYFGALWNANEWQKTS